MKFAHTHADWEAERLKGRKGIKKVRRDLALTRLNDGTLAFTFDEDKLVVTLTPDNTYTLHWNDEWYYYPTYSNILRMVMCITVYRDTSHYKHYAQPIRIAGDGKRWVKDEATGAFHRARTTLPLTNGLQYRDGVCLNPGIAVDFKRTLNREKSLPWLRKTEKLAKVLRVATRMDLLERDRKLPAKSFAEVNLDDPSAADAEIILRNGNAAGLWRSVLSPEQKHNALMRCAENGLADFRGWLYKKHECYEMLPMEPLIELNPEGEKQ